jgi:nucleotide-binding universal stress UspA family protein
MPHLTAILHPTDFSEHSAYAFRLACSLARDHEARLIVLHVVATLGPELVPVGPGEAQLQPEAYQQGLWRELRGIQSADPAVVVEHHLAEGDAVAEILRFARETDCDMIVLGTHGRTGLERLLMGSVAEQIVRKAACPVLTVKSPRPRDDPGTARS